MSCDGKVEFLSAVNNRKLIRIANIWTLKLPTTQMSL